MTPRRPKVLIVDDEDNIVLALHRVLYQDNHQYDVLLAKSAEIAQEILSASPVDVLVTDVHLPEKSGMDLLSWVAVQAPSTRVIVMTAFDIGGIKDRAHAFGCLRLMRKPFDVHEMRAAILRALSHRDSFTGNLSDLSTVDVIQMLCIARKTTALRLSEGKRAGAIHIENGEIVHAVWEDLAGEDAFFRMLAVKKGLFSTSPLPPDVERTMAGDWQYLLIEGLRRLDEANAQGGDDRVSRPSVTMAPWTSPAAQNGVGPNGAAPNGAAQNGAAHPPDRDEGTVTLSRGTLGSMMRDAPADEARSSPEAARLIDEGWIALRAGKRDEARAAWEAALRIEPHNRAVELNLRKLGAAPAPRPEKAAAHGGAERS
jgi:DNA-binding response OmpR family regulator